MKHPEKGEDELPDAFWNKVYAAVVVSLVVVIAALYAFSRHFS